MKNYKASSTVYIWYETKDSTGAGVAPTTNGTVTVYKNNSLTQRSSVSGITHTISFDGNVGMNQIVIDLSDNADAGFYAANAHYQVCVLGQIVDGVTDSPIIEEFGIEYLALMVNPTYWRSEAIPATSQTGVPKIDAAYLLGTAFSTPNTAGVPLVDVKLWLGGTIPAVNITGVPLVDLKYLLGTIMATPTVAGIPKVEDATLQARLTSVRAGYLDNLSAGAVALASSFTTLFNQLGAITGSGINTVLGFFRAIAAKAAALTPSDLSASTTFDNTTDSLEAVGDKVALDSTVAKESTALTRTKFLDLRKATVLTRNADGNPLTITLGTGGNAVTATIVYDVTFTTKPNTETNA